MIRTIALGVTAIFVVLVQSGCSSALDRVADAVLANEVRLDERVPPHTAHAILPSTDTIQILGGSGFGLSCSLPIGAQELAFFRSKAQGPISLQMRQACAFHDYCYRHGNATYGYTQGDCDQIFQEQAFRLCRLILTAESIAECETNARKLVLAVRLGGAGSFKTARAVEVSDVSTFFEFDAYPARARAYRVARVADAPENWVANGIESKAAYVFEIQPSGTQLTIYGWRKDGGRSTVCALFNLPGAFGKMSLAPTLARTTGKAGTYEDWLMWWRGRSLANTEGQFTFLAPGRASLRDWEEFAGGFAPVSNPSCPKSEPLWNVEKKESAPSVASFVSPKFRKEFSEIHRVSDSAPNQLRLMGLTAGSNCATQRNKRDNKTKALMCILDVQLDVVARVFTTATYPIAESDCGPSCGDRYRNFVAPPWVLGGAEPHVIWSRRGTKNGDGYGGQATLRRYMVAPSNGQDAIPLGQMIIPGLKEDHEPIALLDTDVTGPTFLSLQIEPRGKLLQLAFPKAIPEQVPARSTPLPPVPLCPLSLDAEWLQRPAILFRHSGADAFHLILTRVDVLAMDMNKIRVDNLALNADLKVTAVRISAKGTCEVGKIQSFKLSATSQEIEDVKELLKDRDTCRGTEPKGCEVQAIDDAKIMVGKFAARTRGGQLILADVTNDEIPDLVLDWQLDRGPVLIPGVAGNSPRELLRFAF